MSDINSPVPDNPNPPPSAPVPSAQHAPPPAPPPPYGPPPYGSPSYRPQGPQGLLPPVQHAPPPRQMVPGNPRNAAFGCFFILSLLLNVVALLIIVIGCFGAMIGFGFNNQDTYAAGTNLIEKQHSGKTASKNKIVIITLDGVIMEGSLGYVNRQIEQAEKDDTVKAIVLRINSPGGSITASEELHRKLTKLTGYDASTKVAKKPMVVCMGSMAASGGYYVAMPAQFLIAERTTVTGSIGVYASFPNIEKFDEKYGFKMNTIKQGEIKDSGSPFKKMAPKEEQVWQDMVDHAYNQFLDIVEDGRPNLKGDKQYDKLLAEITITPINAGPPKKDKPKAEPYTRYLADGGIWTADDALKHGLIDKVGNLEDAIKEARTRAKLGEDHRVVQYEKPRSLAETLLGVKAPSPQTGAMLDPGKLSRGLAPRVWYLAPGAETAGMLAAVDGD